MKPSVNVFKSNQPKMLSKREDKKSVNLRWNSRLFFQLGLVVSLIVVFFVVESTMGMNSSRAVGSVRTLVEDPPTVVYTVIPDRPEIVKPVEKRIKPVEKQQIIDKIIDVVDDNSKIVEAKTAPTDAPVDPKPNKVETPIGNPIKNIKPRSIVGVEFVPVFPGCESLTNNTDKIACMSSKIRAFIGKKFNTDKFSYLDAGKQSIAVRFKIDVNGNVTDVTARSAIKELQTEAERVIKKLPKMQPGRQGDNAVDVMYMVPITFRIE